jgi:hypothetical protein
MACTQFYFFLSKYTTINYFQKMVDRLEKMKTRAIGNGVTQCLICQSDFGLLSSKSYAAMCIDCRKVSIWIMVDICAKFSYFSMFVKRVAVWKRLIRSVES